MNMATKTGTALNTIAGRTTAERFLPALPMSNNSIEAAIPSKAILTRPTARAAIAPTSAGNGEMNNRMKAAPIPPKPVVAMIHVKGTIHCPGSAHCYHSNKERQAADGARGKAENLAPGAECGTDRRTRYSLVVDVQRFAPRLPVLQVVVKRFSLRDSAR